MSVKETILIVDDTLENLQLLSNMLMEHGYGVRVAVNGSVALKSIQAVLPNLILLDINMPQMDGYEVCTYLKSNPATAEIPIIFMSALNDVLDKVKAFSVGAADYITKPFELEEVLARIENQLQNIRLRKKLQESEEQEREKAEKLAEALQKIQDFQNQVTTEKLLILGKIVSGISYELSNPINFIFGNISHINQYLVDLVEMIEVYQKSVTNPSEEIQKKLKDCDLYFIKSDLPKVLSSMKIGAKRIADTISSLQKFCQQDTSGFKGIDLHESIETTLMILQHRLKEKSHRPKISVKKNYGRLPLIECLPGHLSQVFMNLLSYTIDELDLEDYFSLERQPEIKITTELVSLNLIRIKIADNGKGLEESVIPRIFEPVFEAKATGLKTGLGLSISSQIIVEKHQGILRCSSKLGEGTEFVIEIPVHQPLSKKIEITQESDRTVF